jgi:hypothetical protein
MCEATCVYSTVLVWRRWEDNMVRGRARCARLGCDHVFSTIWERITTCCISPESDQLRRVQYGIPRKTCRWRRHGEAVGGAWVGGWTSTVQSFDGLQVLPKTSLRVTTVLIRQRRTSLLRMACHVVGPATSASLATALGGEGHLARVEE